MVVTRRTSVPMPPTSRTTSTQATPRLNKGKAPQTSSPAQEVEDSLLNGAPSPEGRYNGPQFSDDALFSDGSPPRKVAKDKSKTRSKKKEGKTLTKRKKRPSSWLDIFSRMFILGFFIYTLSVCPTADKQTSPVCRALSEYRRLILEPFVITPVQNLLHHPSVSPYTAPVIEKAQPVIARSQHEWNVHVAPQWNGRVVPQWKKYVVPQWNAYVTPQLARLGVKVVPYRQQVLGIYNKYATPYVEKAQIIVYKTRPYVVVAAAKTYDAYQTSKPYVALIYKELQRLPPLVVKYMIRPLIAARRQFVDPHVALLLEKIKELSSGTTKAPNVVPDASILASPAITPKASKEVKGTSEFVEVELPAVPEPTVNDKPLISTASIASASVSLETDAGEISPPAAPPLSPDLNQESGTFASAASVVSASLVIGNEATESVPGATYSPEPHTELEEMSLVQAAASEPESKMEPKTVYFTERTKVVETVVVQGIVTETLKAPISETPATGNEELAPSNVLDVATEDTKEVRYSVSGVVTQETPFISPISTLVDVPDAHRPLQPVPPSVFEDSNDDLDNLLAELELDLEETIASDAPPAPSIVEETEEEKAAREAQRLAGIAAKRRELEVRHTKWEEKLVATIKAQTALLKDAIASIRRTGAAELKINLAIRAAIETLHAEAEKALRGTDAYFTKLKTGGKPRTEQVRLWDRVLEKVQAKFDERVENVEETVNTWYQEEVLSKESQEIEKASDIVRGIADDAQADIGLDYAWLDDVTYMDWRRYHGLLDKHKAFLDESMALANGSHERPYPNAVLNAFEDLQAEVHDITVGFETRMRRIKREGERAFADDEQTEAEQSAPEVSILPVPDSSKKEDRSFQEVADAILGRSEEEVAAALSRADDQEAKVAHEEL